MVKKQNFIVVGGAGFIGSHIVENLVGLQHNVTVIDNLSSGNIDFLKVFENSPNFNFVEMDIANWEVNTGIFKNIDCLIHLASNADIAAATLKPTIDFDNGTVLTQHVAEISRICKIPEVLYASGSGVYGELGSSKMIENQGELRPISPYGASKLAGEAILCSYSYMYDIKVICFRFGNVVGKNQTHGVGLDFLSSLKLNRDYLKILGDGSQSKHYVHVDDIVNAIFFARNNIYDKFSCINVTNGTTISVKQIAELALEVSGVTTSDLRLEFTGGDRGWKGDVPVVNLSNEKLKELGWEAKLNSKEAMNLALKSIWERLP